MHRRLLIGCPFMSALKGSFPKSPSTFRHSFINDSHFSWVRLLFVAEINGDTSLSMRGLPAWLPQPQNGCHAVGSWHQTNGKSRTPKQNFCQTPPPWFRKAGIFLHVSVYTKSRCRCGHMTFRYGRHEVQSFLPRISLDSFSKTHVFHETHTHQVQLMRRNKSNRTQRLWPFTGLRKWVLQRTGCVSEVCVTIEYGLNSRHLGSNLFYSSQCECGRSFLETEAYGRWHPCKKFCYHILCENFHCQRTCDYTGHLCSAFSANQILLEGHWTPRVPLLRLRCFVPIMLSWNSYVIGVIDKDPVTNKSGWDNVDHYAVLLSPLIWRLNIFFR